MTAWEDIVATKKNYKLMRDSMNSIKGPIVPYVGLYLTDLTFIEDGNPHLYDQKVNVYRRRLTYQVIKEFMTMVNNTPYNIEKIPQIITLLANIENNPSRMTEREQYDTSLNLEPRDMM
jgi:son of sevenless-like protein